MDKISSCEEGGAICLGSTTRGRSRAKWLAVEADAPNMIDESNWIDVVSESRLNQLRAKGIPIHVMLSGGRSVHLHVLFAGLVSNPILEKIARLLRACFLIDTCSCSIHQGMRLPGFVHQTTMQRSRYLGTTGAWRETVEYLKHASRCDPKALLPVENETADITQRKTTYTLSPTKKIDVSHIKLSPDRWALNHEHAASFMKIVAAGQIKSGSFREIVCQKQFDLWVCHSLPTIDEAFSLLEKIATSQVDDPTAEDRCDLLRHRRAGLKFSDRRSIHPHIPNDYSNTFPECFDDRLNALLASITGRIAKNRGEIDVLARRMYQAINSGDDRGFGYAEAASILQTNKMHAHRLMRLFCKYDGNVPIVQLFELVKAGYKAGRDSKVSRWRFSIGELSGSALIDDLSQAPLT